MLVVLAGGSWVVITGVISPPIWVVVLVVLLIYIYANYSYP